MTVILPQENVLHIVQECKVLHRKSSAKVRDFASIFGLMVSSLYAADWSVIL